MKVLTEEEIDSLKIRGYINRDVGQRNKAEFNAFTKLNKYNVNSELYMSLFSGLSTSAMRNVVRFICLNWQNVSQSLNDTPIVNFSTMSANDVIDFFMAFDHRVYFFVEILHQYFFP